MTWMDYPSLGIWLSMAKLTFTSPWTLQCDRSHYEAKAGAFQLASLSVPFFHHYTRDQETLSNYEHRDKQIIWCPMCSLASISQGGGVRPSHSLTSVLCSCSCSISSTGTCGICLCRLIGQVTWGYSLQHCKVVADLKTSQYTNSK